MVLELREEESKFAHSGKASLTYQDKCFYTAGSDALMHCFSSDLEMLGEEIFKTSKPIQNLKASSHGSVERLFLISDASLMIKYKQGHVLNPRTHFGYLGVREGSSLDVSLDGALAVFFNEVNEFRVLRYELREGQESALPMTWPFRSKDALSFICFVSPDGHHLASINASGDVVQFYVLEGAEIKARQSISLPVLKKKRQPDCGMRWREGVLAIYVDSDLFLLRESSPAAWSLLEGCPLKGHTDTITSLFLLKNDLVTSSSSDHKLILRSLHFFDPYEYIDEIDCGTVIRGIEGEYGNLACIDQDGFIMKLIINEFDGIKKRKKKIEKVFETKEKEISEECEFQDSQLENQETSEIESSNHFAANQNEPRTWIHPKIMPCSTTWNEAQRIFAWNTVGLVSGIRYPESVDVIIEADFADKRAHKPFRYNDTGGLIRMACLNETGVVLASSQEIQFIRFKDGKEWRHACVSSLVCCTEQWIVALQEDGLLLVFNLLGSVESVFMVPAKDAICMVACQDIVAFFYCSQGNTLNLRLQHIFEGHNETVSLFDASPLKHLKWTAFCAETLALFMSDSRGSIYCFDGRTLRPVVLAGDSFWPVYVQDGLIEGVQAETPPISAYPRPQLMQRNYQIEIASNNHLHLLPSFLRHPRSDWRDLRKQFSNWDRINLENIQVT